jgi:cytochrome c biogenesis protein CcmG/thiol:disulfide interchange protein DsbE
VSAITSSVSQRRPIARAKCEPLLAIIAGVIVVGLVGFGLTLVQDDNAAATPFDTAVASVDGAALPSLEALVSDAAEGAVAPQLEGTDRGGHALVAPATGRATVILFLAHWCPRCQEVVPVVQGWFEAGSLPDQVDLIGVATASESGRPNYPASAWLEHEDWSVPTISDASGAAATAYGASGFPFWVAVDPDGTVVDRRLGELSPGQLAQLARAARS